MAAKVSILPLFEEQYAKGAYLNLKKNEIATDLESLYEKLSYKLNFVDEITT